MYILQCFFFYNTSTIYVFRFWLFFHETDKRITDTASVDCPFQGRKVSIPDWRVHSHTSQPSCAHLRNTSGGSNQSTDCTRSAFPLHKSLPKTPTTAYTLPRSRRIITRYVRRCFILLLFENLKCYLKSLCTIFLSAIY